jgi:hypothetical protein
MIIEKGLKWLLRQMGRKENIKKSSRIQRLEIAYKKRITEFDR